jgi:hypothetical protein
VSFGWLSLSESPEREIGPIAFVDLSTKKWAGAAPDVMQAVPQITSPFESHALPRDRNSGQLSGQFL